jgi:hypothetical protein
MDTKTLIMGLIVLVQFIAIMASVKYFGKDNAVEKALEKQIEAEIGITIPT